MNESDQPVTWYLRRREDQLHIRFDFYNLTVDALASGGPVLRRTGPGAAFIVVVLPPQHLAEQTFQDGAASDPLVWPVDTRLAGSSRLAFRVPDGTDTVPFTEENLLRWSQFALSVAAAARPRSAPAPAPGQQPPIAEPTVHETAIELPWRLLLSPHAGAGWAHATAPVTRNGRTELWHTRLGVSAADDEVNEEDGERTVRALWATDPDFAAWLKPPGSPGAKNPPAGGAVPAPGLPFRMPLTPHDRVQIVRATSDYGITGFTPQPVDVDELMLTSFGAWMAVHGSWDPVAPALSILDWRHRATAGRDQYVRVMQRGYLLPFGQQATRIAVSERRVAVGPSGARTAYLVKQDFLVVRRPTRDYGGFGDAKQGRRFPFTRLTVTTTATPSLDAATPLVPALGAVAFVPQVGGTPYEFAFVGKDHSGRRVDFQAPVVFVEATKAFDESAMSQIRAAYNALPATGPVRARPLQGRLVAFAPNASPGDTDIETHTLVFAAQKPDGNNTDAQFAANDHPRCLPALATAQARLSALEKMAGAPIPAVELSIDTRYIDFGFTSNNKGEVFATLTTAVSLAVSGERAGPMDPGMNIVALSRRLGPVGGNLDTLAGGTIDVPAILDDAPSQPKILGGMRLSSIVQAIPVPQPGTPPEGAVYFTQNAISGPLPDAGGQGYAQRLSFYPKLIGDPLGIIEFTPKTFAAIDLAYDVTKGAPDQVRYLFRVMIINGRPWSMIGDPGTIDAGPFIGKDPAFMLRLFGSVAKLVEIEFTKFMFQLETGKDALIDVGLGDVRFFGALKFIQKLFSVPVAGAPKPGPIIRPFGDVLEVGVKMSAPPITIGAFTLKNIMFGFAIEIPYLKVSDGKPRAVRFNLYFAERQNPFLLAVYCFGGGGYFKTGFGIDGMTFFEVALEFGVHLEMNFGVASGMIEAMAGIYFRLDQTEHGAQTIELTGYLRLRGQLTALGIVSICLEMYLSLTYLAVPGKAGKLVGQATVTISVEVLFFSTSISFHAERKFSGEQNDPTFLDQMPTQQVWNDYASAFAPIGG